MKASIIEVLYNAQQVAACCSAKNYSYNLQMRFGDANKLYCNLLSTTFHAVQVWKLLSLIHSTMPNEWLLLVPR